MQRDDSVAALDALHRRLVGGAAPVGKLGVSVIDRGVGGGGFEHCLLVVGG